MGRTACTEPQCVYKGALYLYLYLTFAFVTLNVFTTKQIHRERWYVKNEVSYSELKQELEG